MKIISLTGVSIVGNRGAESMLATAIGRIRDRYPDALFNVLSIYPKIDKTLISDEKIKIFSATPFYLVFILFPLSILLSIFFLFGLRSIKKLFPESIRNISESDVFIDLSGVSFIDTRLKFLPYNILSILPAFLLGIPVVKGAQAMGPFKNKLNKMASTIFLTKCTKIFARGKHTFRNFEDIDFDLSKIVISTDIAFLYKNSDSLSDENNDYLENILKKIKDFRDDGNKIIGICPSSVVYSYSRKTGLDYIDFLNKIIKKLISDGYKVLLFPNATRERNMHQLGNNDLPVILKIIKTIQENKEVSNNIIFIDKNLNTAGIRALIEMLDVALVSRFHAMIACLCLSVPLIVIGWSHKYLEVMELFEMEEFVFDYHNSDESTLIKKILFVIENHSELACKIRNSIIHVENLSALQIEYINSLIAKTND